MILCAVLLILCGAKFMVPNMVQGKVTLSPVFPVVSVNASLELTCNTPEDNSITQWGTLSRLTYVFYLAASNGGECKTAGLLRDTKYFETRCYSNGSFKVRIKQVNLNHHGQEWYCLTGNTLSNIAIISVQVPVKYVELENVSGNVLNVIENISYTLTCWTSEGRPSANIKWTRISQKNVEIDITNNVSTTEHLSERNLTIVESNIQLVPKREDDNSLIICRAKNGHFKGVEKKVTLKVQYPPNKPRIFVNEMQVDGTVQLVLGSNVSILCKSDSYPGPTYHWNSNERYEDGPYLNLSNLDKSETWQCTSANKMTLREKTIYGRSSANIKIYLLYPSEIDMFYVIGKENGDYIEATEKETIVFNCSVNSNPKSDIVLKFAEKDLRRNTYAHTLDGSLRVTSCLDDGVYICEAKNQYNSQPSLKELRLSVKCTPIVSPDFDLKSDVTCPQGVTLTLQFKALANPTPQFHWFKLNGTAWKSLENSTKYGIHTADKHTNLTIRNITTNDYGIYKLRIENEIGSLEKLYLLKSNVSQVEQSIFESTTARILLVAVGTFGLIIVVGVVVVIRFNHIRRGRSDSFHRGQIEISLDADANQIPSIEDETVDDAHYHEINVYEHLDQQLTEREDYIEMQSIKSEDSNKYYITPIHLDQQLTEREDNIEMQSIKSEDSNKYYITPIHLDQQLTEREDNIEMQSIKSEDSNKYYITPIHC